MLITANGTAPLEFTESVLREIDFDVDENIEKTMFMKRFGFYKYCENTGIHIYKLDVFGCFETSFFLS